MKIVIITSLFRPLSRGGAEIIVGSIADELKKNHDITVITTRSWGGLSSLVPCTSHEDGMTIIRYFPLNIFSFATIDTRPIFLRMTWHVFDLFSLHTYFVVRSLLRRIEPGCVMTHNLKGIGYTVPLAIRSLNLFHIHTLHDIQLVVPSGLLMHGEESVEYSILSRLHAGPSRMFFASPHIVISPSRFLVDYYRRHRFFSKSKIRVIRNPIPSIGVDESSRSLNGCVIHFIAVGNLNRAKGMIFVLRTFLRWDYLQARLTVIGDGFDREEMESLSQADTRIRILGRLTHEQTLKIMRISHYVIVPSLCYENSPAVILESFANGVPVIVADIGGAAELVREYGGGYCFSPGSEAELRACLTRACAESNYREMSARVQRFAAMHNIEQYCSLLINEYAHRTIAE